MTGKWILSVLMLLLLGTIPRSRAQYSRITSSYAEGSRHLSGVDFRQTMLRPGLAASTPGRTTGYFFSGSDPAGLNPPGLVGAVHFLSARAGSDAEGPFPDRLRHDLNGASRLIGRPDFYPVQQAKRAARPPLRFGKIAAQFGAGIAGGLLLGIVPWVDAFENTRVKGDAGYSPKRNTVMLLSSILTNSLSVFIIGNIGESHGSYPSTALGTLIGSLPLFFSLNDPYYELGAIIVLPLQTVGSIIGFNLSRKYDADRKIIDEKTSHEID